MSNVRRMTPDEVRALGERRPAAPPRPMPVIVSRPDPNDPRRMLHHNLSSGIRRGSAHPFAKLVEEEVASIRSELGAGTGVKALARHFQVCPRTIRDIKKGLTWVHVL